ncbi:MAG: uncharacterized protein KVP18_001959 [Porospora cf. gigantea A]|uniref:uncharacterized protein n=1 Tax=Porospora cf. gigantea A TaxID=2853593 RepID=UPI0035595D21|nr:MAG: hypothetical protein KVP18_001959 [Porospora cf. gigantea A]
MGGCCSVEQPAPQDMVKSPEPEPEPEPLPTSGIYLSISESGDVQYSWLREYQDGDWLLWAQISDVSDVPSDRFNVVTPVRKKMIENPDAMQWMTAVCEFVRMAGQYDDAVVHVISSHAALGPYKIVGLTDHKSPVEIPVGSEASIKGWVAVGAVKDKAPHLKKTMSKRAFLDHANFHGRGYEILKLDRHMSWRKFPTKHDPGEADDADGETKEAERVPSTL